MRRTRTPGVAEPERVIHTWWTLPISPVGHPSGEGVPLFRIAAAAAVIAALLAVAKQQHVLDRAGLTGSCTSLNAPAPVDTVWWACSGGSLTGAPDRSSEGCRPGDARGEVRYWLCPATLVASADSGTR
jgi:hypothetical protein